MHLALRVGHHQIGEGAAAVDPDMPGNPAPGGGHFGWRRRAGYGAMPFFRSSSMA